MTETIDCKNDRREQSKSNQNSVPRQDGKRKEAALHTIALETSICWKRSLRACPWGLVVSRLDRAIREGPPERVVAPLGATGRDRAYEKALSGEAFFDAWGLAEAYICVDLAEELGSIGDRAKERTHLAEL